MLIAFRRAWLTHACVPAHLAWAGLAVQDTRQLHHPRSLPCAQGISSKDEDAGLGGAAADVGVLPALVKSLAMVRGPETLRP